MSVGLLIVTHGELGAELLATATRLLGPCPLAVRTLGVPLDSDPEQAMSRARALSGEIDGGAGLLVLTDLCGATPSNVAQGLAAPGKVRVLSGLNLPMLVRIWNYPMLDLDGLTNKASDGGRDGIRECRDACEPGHHAC